MRVRRGLTSVLLVVAAFWAAMPVFACLANAGHHSCCSAQAQECGSPATMTGVSCCIVQPSPNPPLPGHAAASDQLVNFAAGSVASQASVVRERSGARLGVSTDSPPGSSSVVHSILRI